MKDCEVLIQKFLQTIKSCQHFIFTVKTAFFCFLILWTLLSHNEVFLPSFFFPRCAMQGFFITAFCENLNPGGVIFEKGETSLFSATEAPCHVTWVPVVHPAELHIGTNETKGEHKTRKDTEPISSSTPCKKHLIHVSVLLNRMCWGLISAPRGKGHSVAHIHAAKPWRVTWPIVSTEKDLTPHLNTQAATGQENAHWHRGKPGEKHARHQQSTAPQPG